MQTYDTLSEALRGLKSRGFVRDFNLESDCIKCGLSGQSLSPQQFEIVEVHRFEGDTNPDDEAVLYAIRADDGGDGTLVAAYGTYADNLSADMIARLSVHPG